MRSTSRPRLIVVGARTLNLSGQAVTYTLKKSARARGARLEIRPGEGLSVVLPRRYPDAAAEKLIKDKAAWVLDKLVRHHHGARARHPEPGDRVLYLGRELELVVQASWNGAGVALAGGRMVVSLPQGGISLLQALEAWYREQAREVISRRVQLLSGRLGLCCKKLTVRGQRTRWGSCSRAGSLSFNWRLVMAPEPVIDYVVIHELTHLQRHDHSAEFWQLVSKRCPGWKEHKRWLRDHQQQTGLGLPPAGEQDGDTKP